MLLIIWSHWETEKKIETVTYFAKEYRYYKFKITSHYTCINVDVCKIKLFSCILTCVLPSLTHTLKEHQWIRTFAIFSKNFDLNGGLWDINFFLLKSI